jgi:hypothetical protein
VGGLLLVAPEHRLSFQLKRDELWGLQDATCAEMDRLAAMHYIDIVDEIDVMLHHRYCCSKGFFAFAMIW